MKLKDILKNLEEFETNEERLAYLKELINEIEDEKLIEQVKELIDELEESLETKLENINISPGRRREIELEEVETDIETQERRVIRERPVINPNINLRDVEDREFRYEAGGNYQTQSRPVYQAPQSFFDYQSASLKDEINTNMVEQMLIKEDILSVGEVITEAKRDQLRETVERFMPNAPFEQRLQAEEKIMYDLKIKGKDLKYIPKLK